MVVYMAGSAGVRVIGEAGHATSNYDSPRIYSNTAQLKN